MTLPGTAARPQGQAWHRAERAAAAAGLLWPGLGVAVCLVDIATGLHPLTAGRAAAQIIPPPRGSVSPDGDYAYSGHFQYDPSTCSHDPQGMVFFAVGRRVLRQPMDNLGHMVGTSAADRRTMPHVRRPEEPVGCPDHPVQIRVYHLQRISAMPGDPPGPASADADRISVIVHAGDYPFRRNDLFRAIAEKTNLATSACPVSACRALSAARRRNPASSA